jgi:hypothetical protein
MLYHKIDISAVFHELVIFPELLNQANVRFSFKAICTLYPRYNVAILNFSAFSVRAQNSLANNEKL